MKKLIAGFIGIFMLLMFTMSTVSALFSNSWTASTSPIGAPSARYGHTMVWDDVGFNDMYVWGGITSAGRVNTGAIYSTFDNVWYPISTAEAPSPRSGHTAVWTGDRMIVWGGQGGSPILDTNTGGVYDPGTDTWMPTSITSAPASRIRHTAVWAGDCDSAVGNQPCMIIWGGHSGGSTSSGGKYFPATNTWVPTSLVGVPQSRYSHTAVWTGTEMIVWGGITKSAIAAEPPVPLNTGARYNPITDTWTAIDSDSAPEARGFHTAIWMDGWGTMIVWGGVDCSVVVGQECDDKAINTGGVYDLATNSWWSLQSIGAPGPRYAHTAVWASSFATGVEEMLIWGGHNGSPTGGVLGDGAAYNPATDTWTTISAVGAPSKRLLHKAVWTGTEMIIWGGADFTGGPLIPLGDGKRFTP